jgi:phosphoadenosine phosphosulfate reductase
MKLIKNGTVVDPDWTFCDQSTAGNQSVNQIVPVELFLENPELSAGVHINVDTNLDDIARYMGQLKLIVIEFAAYADGRGFSIAHRLRHSFGFTGQVWGSGSLISDQYAMALQCGIDAVLVDEALLLRQPIEHWRDAIAVAPVPYRYQDPMIRNSINKKKLSRPAISNETIAKLNTRFRNRPTKELLNYVLNQNGLGNTAAISSFGADSVVLLHLIAQTAPVTSILFLDTGKHFSETINYQNDLADKLGLTNIKILHPDTAAIDQNDPQGNLWQSDHATCCNLRKVIPLQKALEGYDSWISGRKSHQNDIRAPLKLFERSGDHIKINPLANWSHDQLADYMRIHDLPAHPLVSTGYASIGCAPCTTPVHGDEEPRAGRWRGMDKTECGIHFVDGKLVREQQQSV